MKTKKLDFDQAIDKLNSGLVISKDDITATAQRRTVYIGRIGAPYSKPSGIFAAAKQSDVVAHLVEQSGNGAGVGAALIKHKTCLYDGNIYQIVKIKLGDL